MPDRVAEYVIPKVSPPLAKSNNDDPLAKVSAIGVTGSRRSLEPTNTDIARHEPHFGTTMERSFATRFSTQYLAASFDPVPWPSSYLPTYADGIKHRWSSPEKPSASEKYASAFGLDVKQFTEGVSRSTGILSQRYRKQCTKYEGCTDQNDGSVCGIRQGEASGYCIPDWLRICHA